MLAKMTILEHSETHDARAAYWSLFSLSNKISSYPVLAWLKSFKNAIGIDFASNELEHHETCGLRHAQKGIE